MNINKEWFCRQVLENEKYMYSVGWKLLENDDDVKDAIQDAILKAYSNIGQLKDEKSFRPWITKILINNCYDIIRKDRGEADITDYENILVIHTADDDTQMDLKQAVHSLKEPYKTVVILHYYQDCSVKEISEITGSQPSAVKKQLQRARQTLKKYLDRR